MRFAADLHLHSRHAGGVSPKMDVPEMARWARRKGIDVLGTGDCLHPGWLESLEKELEPAEPGLYRRRGEREKRELRFLLSVEVCCAPAGVPEKQGLHHLVFFPGFTEARQFQRVAKAYGDLEKDGRPVLAISSSELARLLREQTEGFGLAPAHILNPFYSSLGWRDGVLRLADVFGTTGTAMVLAVEMGLPATVSMCRRVSCLDAHALFANSDAHSPWHIGREYTLFDTVLDFPSILRALREPGRREIAATVKLPYEETRYYLNHCMKCDRSFDGTLCERCGRPLAMGVRDRLLRHVADREGEAAAARAAFDPPCRIRLPLPDLIGRECGRNPRSKTVTALYERLLEVFGDERTILAVAEADAIARVSTPGLAKAIVAQRRGFLTRGVDASSQPSQRNGEQLDFGLS